jgi:hypothetical protein
MNLLNKNSVIQIKEISNLNLLIKYLNKNNSEDKKFILLKINDKIVILPHIKNKLKILVSKPAFLNKENKIFLYLKERIALIHVLNLIQYKKLKMLVVEAKI